MFKGIPLNGLFCNAPQVRTQEKYNKNKYQDISKINNIRENEIDMKLVRNVSSESNKSYQLHLRNPQ